jgi:D-serine/D-alanine/glycine transporter
MIAIGGAIGTGLFMGSGNTIATAGPSIILIYALIGFFLFFVMRALGELLLSNLHYKSFRDIAEDQLGAWAGFVSGWTYWLTWIVVGISDMVAITGYFRELWPADDAGNGGIPLWLGAIITIAVLLGLNLAAVKLFGELEFWFAIIKIVAIIALVVIGIVFIAQGFQPEGAAHSASVANLWNDGGFFPLGFSGFIGGFQIAFFAFTGIELVGTAATETKNPAVSLPKAINAIPVRVALFYIAALVIIMSVMPWSLANKDRSPFIMMFEYVGGGTIAIIGGATMSIAAFVVTIVVLTSAWSSANSGIFSTSRMLFGLAESKKAPKLFAKLSAQKIPAMALFFSCAILCLSIPLLYATGSVGAAFQTATSVATMLFMVVWFLILASYVMYRRNHDDRHQLSIYKVPGGVNMVYVTAAFLVFGIITLLPAADSRNGLIGAAVWVIVLCLVYFFVYRKANPDDEDFTKRYWASHPPETAEYYESAIIQK